MRRDTGIVDRSALRVNQAGILAFALLGFVTDQPPLPAFLAERLRAVVGERGVVTDAADLEPHCIDWRGQFKGRAALLVRPASTDEMSKVVALLAEAGVGIVPQAGNTSLCGASVPMPRARR